MRFCLKEIKLESKRHKVMLKQDVVRSLQGNGNPSGLRSSETGCLDLEEQVLGHRVTDYVQPW